MIKSSLIALAIILLALPSLAQQEVSLKEKAERLAKLADANLNDWQKQYDAGICYLDTMAGGSGLLPAEIYLARALDIARVQTTKRDTILAKSLVAMSDLYWSRGNYSDALAYYEKALNAYIEEFGAENALVPLHIALLATRKVLLSFVGGEDKSTDAVNLIRVAKHLNSRLPEAQRAKGLEEADYILIMAHEILMSEHMSLTKKSAWKWTDQASGKLYTVLAFDDWTCEKPYGLFATMMRCLKDGKPASERKYGLVLLDEEGNTIEQEHPEFQFQMGATARGDAYHFANEGNLRIVSVTPERQKQMVEALHLFEQNKKVQK